MHTWWLTFIHAGEAFILFDHLIECVQWSKWILGSSQPISLNIDELTRHRWHCIKPIFTQYTKALAISTLWYFPDWQLSVLNLDRLLLLKYFIRLFILSCTNPPLSPTNYFTQWLSHRGPRCLRLAVCILLHVSYWPSLAACISLFVSHCLTLCLVACTSRSVSHCLCLAACLCQTVCDPLVSLSVSLAGRGERTRLMNAMATPSGTSHISLRITSNSLSLNGFPFWSLTQVARRAISSFDSVSSNHLTVGR